MPGSSALICFTVWYSLRRVRKRLQSAGGFRFYRGFEKAQAARRPVRRPQRPQMCATTSRNYIEKAYKPRSLCQLAPLTGVHLLRPRPQQNVLRRAQDLITSELHTCLAGQLTVAVGLAAQAVMRSRGRGDLSLLAGRMCERCQRGACKWTAARQQSGRMPQKDSETQLRMLRLFKFM